MVKLKEESLENGSLRNLSINKKRKGLRLSPERIYFEDTRDSLLFVIMTLLRVSMELNTQSILGNYNKGLLRDEDQYLVRFMCTYFC